MFKRHHQPLILLLLAADTLATTAAWMTAYLARFTLLPAPAGVPRMSLVWNGLPWVLALSLVAYRLCGLYQLDRLHRGWRNAALAVLGSGFLFLLIVAVTFYRRDLYESRLALGLFPVLNALALLAGRRLLWRLWQACTSRGMFQVKTLIIGSGRACRIAAKTLNRHPWTGTSIVGCVDHPAIIRPSQVPYLGDIHELPRIIAEHGIGHVFLALPLDRYSELPGIYQVLSDILVEVQLVPDIPSISGLRARTMEFDGVTFVGLRENPIRGLPMLTKRAVDLALASFALLLLSPLFFLLAALIKLTSKGPVFYRQARTGLGGQSFMMWKFRSMRLDAEKETGPVWARRGDDRCTRLGRFMRKWSLDELPQLFNVFAGDMSLVGPRPERGVFIEKFRRQIPCYTQRHQVKAGITGWAQVNGWRGNTSLRRRVECDLYYICNWSLWLDIKILWMTLWSGFRHRHGF